MTKVKICGLSLREHIEYVNEARPDFIGFVFAESPRKVSATTARTLRSVLIEGIIPVGVFVNHPLDEVLKLVDDGTVEMVQLHGGENQDYIRSLKAQSSVPIVQAIDMHTFPEGLEKTEVDMLLLDNGRGGTGQPFDWTRTNGIEKKFFLAGGLNLHNVKQAITATRPYAVDISSGVERAGRKDRDLIIETVRRVRDV